MKYFNAKQIEKLKPAEEHFHTVIYARYKRATSSKLNDLVANLYEEVTNEILDRNWSCAHCTYAVFEKCGKLFYASVEKLNKKQQKQNSKESKTDKTE